jgi:hypothetical protein
MRHDAGAGNTHCAGRSQRIYLPDASPKLSGTSPANSCKLCWGRQLCFGSSSLSPLLWLAVGAEPAFEYVHADRARHRRVIPVQRGRDSLPFLVYLQEKKACRRCSKTGIYACWTLPKARLLLTSISYKAPRYRLHCEESIASSGCRLLWRLIVFFTFASALMPDWPFSFFWHFLKASRRLPSHVGR